MWGTRRREPERGSADPSLGQVLAGRREGKGLSREAAAIQAGVPLQILVALETDDFRGVPDARYLIRFVGNYGVFLGLDAEALRARFLAGIRRPFSPIPPPPEPFRWREVLRPPVIGTALGVGILVPIVFIAWSLLSDRAPPPPAPAPAPPTVEGGPLVPVSDLPAPPVEAGAGGPAPAPPAEARAASPAPREVARTSGHLLRVVARELTWLAVAVDGGESREAMLRPGEVATWRAERQLRLTVGNAGGVRLSLDGTDLPPLGASGQVVRDLVLP